MHFYPTFFLSGFRISTDSLKDKVRKEGDGGGINDLKLLHPLWSLTFTAVLGKLILISGIQVCINGFENGLRSSGISIRQSTSPGHDIDTKM